MSSGSKGAFEGYLSISVAQVKRSLRWLHDHVCFLLPLHHCARSCCPGSWTPSGVACFKELPIYGLRAWLRQMCSALVFRNGAALCVHLWPMTSWFWDLDMAPWLFSVPVALDSSACGHQGCCGQQDRDKQEVGPGPGAPSSVPHVWTTWVRLTWGNCLKWRFHNGPLLSHKKEWNNAICSNMIIILSEVSQTEKDKYHMISLPCGI